MVCVNPGGHGIGNTSSDDTQERLPDEVYDDCLPCGHESRIASIMFDIRGNGYDILAVVEFPGRNR